jgi:hypothetical protein
MEMDSITMFGNERKRNVCKRIGKETSHEAMDLNVKP